MGGDEAGGVVAEEGGGALTPEAWQLAFRRGLGRALERVNEVEPDVVRPVLLDACLNDRAFEAQIEGLRARWMAEFIQRSSLGRELVTAVLDRVEEPTEVDWDAESRLEVLARLAQAGRPELRELVRQAYAKLYRRHPRGLAPTALLLIDGREALLPFARLVGERLLTDPDDCEDERTWHEFDDYVGEGGLREALLSSAGMDVLVARVLQSFDETRAASASRVPPVPQPVTEADLEAMLAGSETSQLISAGRRLSDLQVRDVFSRLESERDEQLLVRLLILCQGHYFRFDRTRGRVCLPLPERVRELAREGTQTVQEAALDIIERVQDPAGASLAREALRLGPGRAPLAAFGLLGAHCETGDVPAVLTVLRGLPTDEMDPGDLQYGVVVPLFSMAESPAGPALAGVFEWVYEHAYCGCCRAGAVDRLRKWGALDANRRAECRDDSSDDVRESAGW